MSEDTGRTVIAAYHNLRGTFRPYEPGDPLSLVFRHEFAMNGPSSVVLDWVFERLNLAESVEPEAVRHYWDARNRSLSVGDVVTIGEAFYACEREGWRPIDGPLHVTNSYARGTVPIALA